MSRREISSSMVWLAVAGLVVVAGAARGQSSLDSGTARARLQEKGDGALEDQVSGLLWTATDNGEDIPWSEAQEFCRELALGAADDWRLATIEELETLVDRRGLPLKVAPEIDLSAFWVWSGEPHESLLATEEERPMAWFLSFLSGKPGVTHADRSAGLRALCVSGS